MRRKIVYQISFVLVLAIVSSASAELVAHWKLDEGSGTTTVDATGNGHDGTLEGNTQWVDGYFAGALQFAGSPDRVVVPYSAELNPETAFTASVWANVEPGSSGWRSPITSRDDAPQRGYIIYAGSDGNWQFWIGTGSGWSTAVGPPIQAGEWTHVAAVYDNGQQTLYINGSQVGQTNGTISLNEQQYLSIGAGRTDWPQGDYFFAGKIDDVRVYNHALTEEDVAASMLNQGGAVVKAYGPNPADGALHEDTWVNLSWKAGDFAVSHDVYIGDNFEDVDNGSANTLIGNQAETFIVAGFPGFPYPDGLVPGTTYYWRIDEVNEAEPNSPWKGDIWSFSIPPKTAYNPDPADRAEFVATDATLSWTPGFGAKLHTVYIGTDYDTVNNAAGGLPQGTANYKPAAPLEEEKVYYWRVDEFDALDTYKGDVWAFTTPGAAGSPSPANRATGVQMTEILSWTPAATAVSHDLYFGTDKDAVMNATTASPEYKGNKASGAESYDPGKLAWNSDYYWRVDAVYSTGTVRGLVWSFTTADFITVDDFESYNDIDPPDPNSNRIFESWIDGFGTTDNGALVGNDLPPYAEQTIVHGGAQSMPYRYDNTNKTSEATLTLVYPRDWTEEGVTRLSLWFRGGGANAADKMYIALNGNAVVYHDNTSATQKGGWNEWVIDLQAFADQGVNLANVNTITIGIGTKGSPAAGGMGTMYFDDIRLIR